MTDRRTLVQAVSMLLVVGSLLTGAAGLQYVREQKFPAPPIREDSLYLTSGEALRRVTVGYSALAADLYWIRAIQYYGSIRLRLANQSALNRGEALPTGFPLLYPLLDITTALDPLFNIAYRFGSVFLAEPFPGGAGRPDLAIALLAEGLKARPSKWEYMQDIGFVNYWWLHDYESAADWFDRASRVPGAPWWLRSLAAATLAEGGDRRSSRMMWEAIHESAEIDWLRRDAERRLAQLRVLDDVDALQTVVDHLTKAVGAPPTDWTEIIRAGFLKGIPVDPTGLPYVINPQGQVEPSPTSELLPLPEEPKRISPIVS